VLAPRLVEAAIEPKTTPKEDERGLPPERVEHPFGAPPKDLPPLDPPPPTRVVDTSGVELELIDLAKRSDRKRFLDVSAPLYAKDPNYLEPLRMERMHFLDPNKNRGIKSIEIHALIAHQNGKPVGRITGHIDHGYDRYHETNAGWFGFFESIDDKKVAHALLGAATKWVKQKGAVEIIGPMNFNTNGQAGLLVKNFDRPPMIEMTYNPPYYESLLTSFGFGKAKDLYAWWIDVSKGLDNEKVARIARIADRVKKREGITIRQIKIKDFKAELERLFTLYNEAWQKNWGFVPLERDEFEEIATNLKPITREELMFLVEVQGKPVGFSVSLPNVNEVMPRDGRLFPFGWLKLLVGLKLFRIQNARLFTLGVIPEYRKRGLETMMFVETALRARDIGINSGEIGWTLEDNWLINRSIEAMDGKLDRIYRLFGLTL
jgi:GNAT superfamily N-acetyltransferase